jgi:CO dehydrogenase nickel-insertion accessory protein CooC1
MHAEPILTLVDFKAGFEDTARGVVTRMDWVMVIVDPTQASLVLAMHMKKMVKSIRAGQLPATRHLDSAELVTLANRLFQESPLRGALIVLNKIADEKIEAFLRAELTTQGIEPIGIIQDDPDVSEAWLKGSVINGSKTRSDVETIVWELEKTESGG